MSNESTPGKGPDERRVRPGAEARNLPTPEDLRSYADDADQHGNHWVPIAPASLRGLADEIERLRAVALQHISHSYEGGCPDDLDQMLRDPNCPACQVLGPNAKAIPPETAE